MKFTTFQKSFVTCLCLKLLLAFAIISIKIFTFKIKYFKNFLPKSCILKMSCAVYGNVSLKVSDCLLSKEN